MWHILFKGCTISYTHAMRETKVSYHYDRNVKLDTDPRSWGISQGQEEGERVIYMHLIEKSWIDKSYWGKLTWNRIQFFFQALTFLLGNTTDICREYIHLLLVLCKELLKLYNWLLQDLKYLCDKNHGISSHLTMILSFKNIPRVVLPCSCVYLRYNISLYCFFFFLCTCRVQWVH